MKIWFLLILIIVELPGCKTKDMTLEELKKASWSMLDNGVEYINLEDKKGSSFDSIHFNVKGFWGTNITVPVDIYNDMHPEIEKILRPILLSELPESKRGYLKVNIFEMTSPEFLTAFAYLRNDIDSSELSKGLQAISSIEGVTEVSYVSKEMAAKKYLADGNTDWKKVLDSNPLPASIEIKFNRKLIKPHDYEKFKTKIEAQMLLNITDISFPKDLYRKFEGNYYILEYNRS